MTNTLAYYNTELITAVKKFGYSRSCRGNIILFYKTFFLIKWLSMFVERVVSYSALFTFLVGWHASAVCLPPGFVILAQLACPMNDVNLCLHQEQLTYLSTKIDVSE
jgi:hypothetical protein